MKRPFEDFLPETPPQTGNGGKYLKPKGPQGPETLTAIDLTTRNARRVLEEEAEERAEKTARLRAARERRDGGTED